MAMRKPLSRRSFLRGAGGVLVALPPLSAMLKPRQSVAEANDIPTRAVFFFSPNGTILRRWRPNGTVRNFTLSEILSPLEPHKASLNILDGIAMQTAIENSGGRNQHDIGTGHALVARRLIPGPTGFGEFGHLFDGTAGGESVDQTIARHFGKATPFDSLQFGVQSRRLRMPLPSRITWRTNGTKVESVEPMQEPSAAFERIFGAVNADEAALARTRTKRQLIVDAVLEDYRSTRSLLGAEDRQRLDAHIAGIEDLERRIAGLGGGSQCDPPSVDGVVESDFRQVGTAQMDLLAAALSCDLTRVATLQWETGQGENRFSWLGANREHHDLSHDGNSATETQDVLTAINKF